MSKRDIQTVCTLAAHLAQNQRTYDTGMGTFEEYVKKPAECAADAMKLQRLGRRARRNAAKRWIHPENRDTREEIRPYIDECARISRESAAILSPYGLEQRHVVVHRDGITILGWGNHGFTI